MAKILRIGQQISEEADHSVLVTKMLLLLTHQRKEDCCLAWETLSIHVISCTVAQLVHNVPSKAFLLVSLFAEAGIFLDPELPL